MNVPLMNLKAALEETESVWRRNLEQLFERAQFILGPELSSFEQEFAAELNADFAIGVGSGSAAIELCLREAGITSREQEVITSPLTAPFTGIAILAASASIRFADIDPETLLLDPASVAEHRTSQTAAIVPVHLYGQPCDLARLSDLGLPLIQDACQAHGALCQDLPLTKFSPWVTYSFYPTKNLGAIGDGGAIVTNSETIAQRLRMLRDGGRSGGHVSVVRGINSRLDDLQCCFLRAFLPKLAEWNASRTRVAARYDEAFQNLDGLRRVKQNRPSAHHLYVVRTTQRDPLREFLESRGIGTGVHYPSPLHLHPAFESSGVSPGDLPHAEEACREILSLPLWPSLKETEVNAVIDSVRAFFRA